ncbi:hypothetical protein RDWZM_007897 [Blomia tropicalis]|uniref:Eukaryotic translation initiation factor 3 subunit C n=1 Tax=Blomia tropicalis TaxID=40697 RepID=A0A9Q0M3I2_BLOTA|nr:hypothetical protein RDWZM_007897 [Blomia tropicalis]
MSGRFFKHLSDTESESEDSEEEVIQTKAPIQPTYGMSDDEEETKRVVRTAKEKHYDELNNIIKLIRNHKKIKDVSKLLSGFEDLTRAFQKAKTVIDREENGKIPKFYIRTLAELEDFVNENWEDRKNMNKNNSKSLTTMRQKLRKYNKDFEQEISDYRENPEDIEDEKDSEVEESDSDDSRDIRLSHERTKSVDEDSIARNKIQDSKDDGGSGSDSDDSIDWDISSDSDSSDSDDDYGGNLAAKFLKKDTDKDKEIKKREKKVKERKKKEDEGGEWTTVEGSQAAEKPKMFAKDAEINHQVMAKKLIEVMAMRGKKRVDRLDQIDMLNELLTINRQNNFGPALEVKILLGLQSALTDYGSSSCMKVDVWRKYLDNMDLLIELLNANPEMAISETIPEDQESFQNLPYKVQGCILTWIEKMDEEFVKMLQVCDAHSPDYIERLRDEIRVVDIIERVRKYLENATHAIPQDLCRVYILTIDYLYYKFDSKIVEMRDQAKEKITNHTYRINMLFKGQNEEDCIPKDDADLSSLEIIDRLCKYIYVHDQTERIRKLAILCQVYNYALHDCWFESRDLMLMSCLPSTILNHKSDIQLQVLYNRALVQLGLCAFRHGHIQEAHSSLLDILLKGRVRELLAQGFNNKTVERSPEQAKLEKRCQIPFHKHINVDLIECVYLVSSMLLEIPDVASNEFSVRKKLISRSFFNQLRKNEEQPLVGVPEAMREHVVAASKAMRIGNWKQCQDYIINEKMNAKVWNFFYNADNVRAMLSQKIREESLRTYLFTYSHVYDSISIDTLAEMFSIESATVHSQISKMIINEELMASLDEPTRTVVMHRTEPSRIQSLALQLADKVHMLLEYNERLWELKMTPLGHFNQGGRYDRNFQNRTGNRRDGQRQGTRGQGGGNRQNRGGYYPDRPNRERRHRQPQTARE